MSVIEWETVGVDPHAVLPKPQRFETVPVPEGTPPSHWEYTLQGRLPLPLVEPDVRWQIVPEGILCFTVWVPDGTQAALPALLRRIADVIDAQAPA